jgi:hypothetical protein
MHLRQLLFLAVITCSGTAFAQNGVALYGGAGFSRLRFDEFKDFVTAYNDPSYLGTTGGKELKFQPLGMAYEGGAIFRGGGVMMGLGFARMKTFSSVAGFPDGERHIQLTNWNYNFMAGYQIAGFLMPYFSFGISAMHIDSYYQYGDVRSYGSEKTLSGIYSSWKGTGSLGIRIEKAFGRFGPYVDFNYAFKKKEYLNGSFDITTNSTEDYSFPQDPKNAGSIDPDLALPEHYRNIRLTAGIVFYLFQFDEDED